MPALRMAAFCGLAGCSPSASAPAPKLGPQLLDADRELAALDVPARLGDYAAHDSVWASPQPLLVGSDFDFGLASALDTVGAGVAAAKRQRDNRELGELAARQPRLSQASLLALLLEHCRARCSALEGKRVLIYGVLYGGQAARLRVIVEVEDAASRKAYAALSGAAPARDLAQAPKLALEFGRGLAAVASLLGTPNATATVQSRAAVPEGRCAIGDASHVTGRVVSSTSDHVRLELAETAIPSTLLCPSDGFSPSTEPAREAAR